MMIKMKTKLFNDILNTKIVTHFQNGLVTHRVIHHLVDCLKVLKL